MSWVKEDAMVDIHDVLAVHRSKKNPSQSELIEGKEHNLPTLSKIPDVFFDEVLVDFKLNRIEVLVLMYLYRRVWCRPNLYKEFGISQLMAHSEMSVHLKISIDDIYHSLRKLEELGFISTIRSGQYFVRRFFTRDNDEKFGQSYDDFDI